MLERSVTLLQPFFGCVLSSKHLVSFQFWIPGTEENDLSRLQRVEF